MIQKEQVVSALHLPEDVFLGEMLLYISGSRKAVVENYRGILFFSESFLKVRGKQAILTLRGRNLRIAYYDSSQLEVQGNILSAEFSEMAGGSGWKFSGTDRLR